MSLNLSIEDPTPPECPTCGGCRVSALLWGGATGWIPVRCQECCDHRLVKVSDLKCPECGFDLPPVGVA